MLYYNLGIFINVLAIISICYDRIVLAKVTAEVWENSNIATTKSDQARNMTNSLARLSKPLYLEEK